MKYRVGSRMVFERVADQPYCVDAPQWPDCPVGTVYRVNVDGGGDAFWKLVEKPEPRPVDATDAERLAKLAATVVVSGHYATCVCHLCEVVATAKEILSRLETEK